MAGTNWGDFRKGVTEWYRPESRPMPWKAISDPYKIWLSEIILQQTRVEQGLPYYNVFVKHYPTVTDLASAEDGAVMKLWEGLGYYSRARNLLKAARMVANEMDGSFPDTYTGLLVLPGVGPYTAAAIASFAFERQVAVLDGNVFRILARYAGDSTPIDTGKGRKHYQGLVDSALGDAPAKKFNQAIMDFGATVCTPKNAGCASCLLAKSCTANLANTVYDYPIKEKKLKRRTRYFHYLVLEDEKGRTVVQQRMAKDIWQELYEYPLVETVEADVELSALATHQGWPTWLPAGELKLLRSSPPYRHQLTHQTIVAVFHRFRWKAMPVKISGQTIVKNKMFNKLAFPRVITRFLEEKSLLLDLF
jgi:A/G-specific adenine glycosylase